MGTVISATNLKKQTQRLKVLTTWLMDSFNSSVWSEDWKIKEILSCSTIWGQEMAEPCEMPVAHKYKIYIALQWKNEME